MKILKICFLPIFCIHLGYLYSKNWVSWVKTGRLVTKRVKKSLFFQLFSYYISRQAYYISRQVLYISRQYYISMQHTESRRVGLDFEESIGIWLLQQRHCPPNCNKYSLRQEKDPKKKLKISKKVREMAN